MTRKLLFSIALITLVFCGFGQNAWINEFHYDNASGDVNEFVEVVIENAASYTLSDFVVYKYNGSNGTTYGNDALDVFTVGATVGNFTIYHIVYPANGLQNGAPDGLALVYQGAVISGQFISYEGVLTATDGPANGLTSVDIGVAEVGTTPIGESLQLSGSGTSYTDFAWNPPAAETPGLENNGQSLGGVADPEPSNYPTNFTATATGLMIDNSWTDATGAQLPSAYLVLISDQDNIVAPVDGSFQTDDLDLSDGTGALNVAYGVETSEFFRLLSETTYYFEIYPYTNAGSNVDFKTDGSAPSAMAITAYAINTADFETGDTDSWSTYNVASDKDWQVLDYGGAHNTTWFASMNGYGEDVPSNDWLISPSLNMDNYSAEMLVFYTLWKYGNLDNELTLKYSTDYVSGDPTLATWTNLTFDVAAASDVWASSGAVDLTAISGDNVHIAFQYLSSGSPRRWYVDEIEITGVAIVPIVTVVTPNGGEVFEQGESVDVSWTYADWTGNIEIYLLKENENPMLLASNVDLESGSWTWNVFPNQAPGNDYKIEVVGMDSNDPSDESDAYFSIIEQYNVPELVLTEIMYNPPEAGDDSLEFVEIYNNGQEMVNLDGFSFTKGFVYEFPSLEILAGDFVLVSKDSVAMFDLFGVTARQWTSGALSNSGEEVELSDAYGNIVDYVAFEDNMPWDTLADGYGPSLTLCNPDTDNSLPENWTASVNFAGINMAGDSIWATPGFACVINLLAGFEADQTNIALGGSVVFTDLSLGDPVEWTWTFEGGTPGTWSGQTPPAIVYNEEGAWDVSLWITDGTNVSELIYEDYVVVVNLAAPANLVAVAGPEDDVQLSWDAPPTGEILGYNVYRDDLQINVATVETTEFNDPEPSIGSHDYYVTAVYNEGESNASNVVTVMVTGINEVYDNGFLIYPNPGNGVFTIELTNQRAVQLSVVDLCGLEVFNKTIHRTEQIHISDIKKGIYLVRIIENASNTIGIKKLVVR